MFCICRIHVGDLLAQGVENGGAKLQTLKYRVVRANKSYCGEIDVGVTFTPKVYILHKFHYLLNYKL